MIVNPTTDDDLVARAREGSGDAAEILVRRHAPALHAFLQRQTGSAHDAQDLLQDTLARFLGSLGGYEPRGQLRAYLFRIASNLMVTRAGQRHRKDEPLGPQMPDRTPGPDVVAAGRARATQVRAALATLPPDQREALVLCTYHEMSYEDVARLQGASLSAVKVRIFRAREALRERFSEEVGP